MAAGISSLLTEAHLNQQRLPLLVVAVGLGDTKEVLAQRGASKLATNDPPGFGGRFPTRRCARSA